MEKLKPGTPVSFLGYADKNGEMLSAQSDGPDSFRAWVANELTVGDTYCLSWKDGSPVGIPFHRDLLTVLNTNRPPITHVAIRFQDKIYSLPKPNRHHDVIRHIIETNPGLSYVDAMGDDQGFLDESGRYLNRKQALLTAKVNDQLLEGRPIIHNQLFSENLW